jgi:Ni,Fe-hydrogenase III small subunit
MEIVKGAHGGSAGQAELRRLLLDGVLRGGSLGVELVVEKTLPLLQGEHVVVAVGACSLSGAVLAQRL